MKFKKIQNQGELGSDDCAKLRELLKAAIDAGLPDKVGKKLGEGIDELCG
ncbi:MAG: hypothetical protein H8D23_26145 [Candidatus Brocadiales bacterium]|nr:hypothetical protein [Candidatus Brocadiales bacterium]